MNFKKLGIVLSGGGGKGAYQIGVWNALREIGLESHIAAVAGTSVGGLNGAMIAQGRYELAEKMWLKVERHNLMTLEGVPGLAEWLAQKLPPGRVVSRLLDSAASKGLFKREGLQAMIEEGVDTALLANSTVPLTVAWHHDDGNRVVYRTLRDPAVVADGLLATAALPMIFDQVSIEGELYSDGGFYWGLPGRKLDNIPVKALEDAGCDTVIVICLSRDDLTVSPHQFPGMRVIPIVPRHSLGNVMATLDFSNDGAARRMEQGYADAKEILRHLEMYLATGERYQQLWDQVARNAAGEAETDARTARVQAEHSATVEKIADFDKIVAADRFDRPLDAAPEAEDGLPSAFGLASEALLSELDRERIHTNVERFLATCGKDRNAVEESVLEAIGALAPVAGRAGGMRDEGVMSRILGAITGRNQKLSADNQLALAEGQYAVLRLVNAVQRQGALSLEFSCVLQNRLQAALQEMARQGQRHNEDLQRVYRSMAQVYGKLRDRLMQHDARIDALERQGRLLSWLVHINARRYHGRRLAELPQTLRLVTLANEFFHRTEGRWSVDELMSAQEMCYRVELEDVTLTAGAFFKDLLDDRISASTLTDGLVTRPLPVPPGGAAGWLLDLRNRRLSGGMDHTVACWNYGADTRLAAWDLLVEMLYHMRAAGLAPVRHGSEMAALKAEWSAQLGALEALVDERLLPAAFRREIEPIRRAIEGFRLKVPLVGKFSAGKSSLINCWLDRDVQQIDLGACTAVPVEFHVAASGQEKLVVSWAPAAPEAAAVREEFPDPYMAESRVMAFAQGRSILHIERHCDIPALGRYPDLVVVDTPGIGSVNIDHDSALAHYLGDGVLFILCANRGQVGTEELAFIRRQKQLGQEFSLLVCQEDLNNPSERESLQRSLAEQAGLAQGQLVRGCSAQDRNLAGFDDLLAHVERSKTALFAGRHRPLVEELVQRAERLLAQTLSAPDDAELRQRLARINSSMAALDGAFRREEQAFLSDCAGSVARTVVAEVGSFMRARRSAYAQRLEDEQEIRNLVVADAQNAFELATRKHFSARLDRAAQVIEQQADIGRIGTLDLGAGDGPSTAAGAGGLGDAAWTGARAAAGALLGAAAPAASVGGSAAMFGAAAGSVLPGIGTAIGAVLGGLVGAFLLGKGKRVTSESRAAEAIELVCTQVEAQAVRLLEAQAREALVGLRRQLEGRLETERENLARIEEMLQEHASKKDEMKKRAGAALAQVRAMVTDTNAKN
jgi:predicted acylesterase/phospholipase RssA